MKSVQCWLFCLNLVATETPLLHALKIQIASIFEFTDPENPTIHAKTVSISCIEMKLWLLECLAYLNHCGWLQSATSKAEEAYKIRCPVATSQKPKMTGNDDIRPTVVLQRYNQLFVLHQ